MRLYLLLLSLYSLLQHNHHFDCFLIRQFDSVDLHPLLLDCQVDLRLIIQSLPIVLHSIHLSVVFDQLQIVPVQLLIQPLLVSDLNIDLS